MVRHRRTHKAKYQEINRVLYRQESRMPRICQDMLRPLASEMSEPLVVGSQRQMSEPKSIRIEIRTSLRPITSLKIAWANTPQNCRDDRRCLTTKAQRWRARNRPARKRSRARHSLERMVRRRGSHKIQALEKESALTHICQACLSSSAIILAKRKTDQTHPHHPEPNPKALARPTEMPTRSIVA